MSRRINLYKCMNKCTLNILNGFHFKALNTYLYSILFHALIIFFLNILFNLNKSCFLLIFGVFVMCCGRGFIISLFHMHQNNFKNL